MLWSCSEPARPVVDSLPQELPGAWKRGSVSPVSSVPAQAAELGVEDTAQTTYTGPNASVQISAFRMRTDTNALELMQRWRHDEGAAAYKGSLFLVARSEDRNAALTVLRALQQ
jgi:hypothetical protein